MFGTPTTSPRTTAAAAATAFGDAVVGTCGIFDEKSDR